MSQNETCQTRKRLWFYPNEFKVRIWSSRSLQTRIRDADFEYFVPAVKWAQIRDQHIEDIFRTEFDDKIEAEVIISLFRINLITSGEEVVEVLVELEKQGLRPVNLAELLALAAQYPSLKKEYDNFIVALGSIVHFPADQRQVAYFGMYHDEDSAGTTLYLGGNYEVFLNNESEWVCRYCRFAAVHK